MTCAKCGAAMDRDARFCGACGSPAPAPPGPEPKLDLGAMQTFDPGLQTRQPSRSEVRRLQPGVVFADRYTIGSIIGEGGMGVVYRAVDRITDAEVALKLIRADRLAGADAVKRLIREGVTSRNIRHPNVVAVYDVGETAGQPYMSMEYLDGRSLRAWNREKLHTGECSMAAAAHIVREILAGLEAAHAAGVVHRDLKPENVMLLSEPTDAGVRLKLLDFGVARAPNTGDTGATSLGTRGYMAPEQLTAPDAAQPSADLYSLSVMFYELLVGVVPQNFWQPPSGGRGDVPQAVDKLIERGLAPSPRSRPQSAAEYRATLEDALKPVKPDGLSSYGMWTDRPEVRDTLRKTADFINRGGVIGALRDQGANKPEPAQTGPAGGRSLWDWFRHCISTAYAKGSGRAHRKEYWGFNLGAFAILFLAAFIDAANGAGGSYDVYGNYNETPPVMTILAWLALITPSVAVASRRMHDLGYSGWMAALLVIPALGTLIAVLMGIPRGAPGANAYGPDPLAETGDRR